MYKIVCGKVKLFYFIFLNTKNIHVAKAGTKRLLTFQDIEKLSTTFEETAKTIVSDNERSASS